MDPVLIGDAKVMGRQIDSGRARPEARAYVRLGAVLDPLRQHPAASLLGLFDCQDVDTSRHQPSSANSTEPTSGHLLAA
jgi:hypothetical protein